MKPYLAHSDAQQYDIAVAARIHYQGQDHDTGEWHDALRELNPECEPGATLPGWLLHQVSSAIIGKSSPAH